MAAIPIPVIAVVQGWLLYGLHYSLEHKTWPATETSWLFAFYAIALFVPVALEIFAARPCKGHLDADRYRSGNPAIRPHLVRLTNGNAVTKTDDLGKLRHALLQLHKALLDAQRIRYERVNGRVESRGELLDLVLRDASFEWLRVLSALIARLDELVAADDKDAGAELRGVIDRLRKLVRFEGNSGFTDPYREIIEAVPDALVAHVQLSRLLADFGTAARAG